MHPISGKFVSLAGIWFEILKSAGNFKISRNLREILKFSRNLREIKKFLQNAGIMFLAFAGV